MMKFIHKLTIVLALGGICGLAACSDDDQGFLKRNLREMSFPYVESSDTFTIRATGDWQISDTPDSREWTNAYGWVHVDQLSGKGDPGTYQKVTVTCDQNTSEERNATIYLHGCGEENVAIAIRQDNGIFEWKPFDNGQQFDVSGMLKLNAEAGAKLRIPYIKALGTEKYTVTVTQTGGEGITAASGSYSISAAGNGYIEVPLTGTATRQGIIVVVYDGETKLEKLTVPANVKFDAEAVYSDKLTLEWDEVPGAASYTVAWWADGTEEKDATVAEGITSASYLLKELEAGTEYHAKVKACRYNNPGYDSDYSAVVSQKTDIAPVQAGIVVSKVLATSSTLTVEWARADGQACVNSSAQVYHVKLYSDAECKDLFVGWNASNVFGITAGNRFRFTFSGLAPATTYYVCVDDKTNDFFSDPLAYATAAAGPQAGATAPGSAKAGDILLAEDFSKVIHGGDIANFAAGYYPPSSNRGTYAAASGDNPSGFSATRCTANEFDLFSGGGVAAPYTEGTGLSAWGKSGNIAGRPGYVKMGAGSAAASLYTPELTALPDAATVKVRFSAQAYSEKYDGSGADAGKILVKAVRGAVLGAKGAITGTVTEVSAADPVDISAAKARFREFEATLTNVTPDCRIVISTSEKRALLDNVVVTCTAITPATKPAAPGGVSFDAAAAADRLTLKWNAVPDATSYTVAYWKGSASAPESEYAYKTGIASTATSQELTNLESNTSYWAKVKAVGSLDSDWSETANATTMDSGGEPLLPTADLLDVVFRNDGSAMDNSSSATPVRRMPSSRP